MTPAPRRPRTDSGHTQADVQDHEESRPTVPIRALDDPATLASAARIIRIALTRSREKNTTPDAE